MSRYDLSVSQKLYELLLALETASIQLDNDHDSFIQKNYDKEKDEMPKHLLPVENIVSQLDSDLSELIETFQNKRHLLIRVEKGLDRLGRLSLDNSIEWVQSNKIESMLSCLAVGGYRPETSLSNEH